MIRFYPLPHILALLDRLRHLSPEPHHDHEPKDILLLCRRRICGNFEECGSRDIDEGRGLGADRVSDCFQQDYGGCDQGGGEPGSSGKGRGECSSGGTTDWGELKTGNYVG